MCYAGGIREFVTWLNKTKDALHSVVIYMSGMKDDSMAEVAFQYNDGYNETILSFANNVHTRRAACMKRASSGADHRAQQLRPEDQDAQGR